MIGPVQLLIVGFGEEAEMKGEILAELERLSEADIVRVMDVLIVAKGEDGLIAIVDANEDGIAATLTGLVDEDGDGVPDSVAGIDDPNVLVVADEIPPGATVAIVLLEHRWALGLKGALQNTGGMLIAESWIDPLELEAIGLS
jgi:hypothetical protein